MSDPSILFVKPGAISQRDKKMLRDAGILIVEVDDPANVKFVRAHSELSGSDLLLAATRTISRANSDYIKSAFGQAICAALEAQMGEGKTVPVPNGELPTDG